MPASLQLLGQFALHDDRPLSTTPVCRRLLAYLALRGHPVSRAVTAAQLWPDLPAQRAHASLRTTLWRLTGRELVSAGPSGLALAGTVRVDVREAHRLAGDPEADMALFERDLLPDWPEDWLLLDREWFHELRLRALEALGEAHLCQGRPVPAWAAATAVVRAEPLRESGHRLLLRLHLAEGNAAAALRHYERFRRQLRAELGVAPSPRLHRLIAPLVRG
ncbi:BTAD domain-containing putative transcriptional regulator [Crossiella sp. CA-258035]|uniref:AfsR/SARP family transcriptional regulator n=1 Tax=Crossiella sp. CA-258035 TaxID=2981138 RepID=UPI0024BC8655|nr:BTAD domain-containing putative transcriptional regulator [Crossiella sp. CA-258035]WHT17514.1 BTAD domain-containing putative transcriptional regulator [Crossiella sp. CA-258035]